MGNIIDSVDKRGNNFQRVFEFCYRYKLYWTRSGQPTPIVDKIVFNKIKKLLGGRMRFAITGGAPLSPETHDFIRVCLGLTLVQGYSLTETTCTGTCMMDGDKTTGRVGAPHGWHGGQDGQLGRGQLQGDRHSQASGGDHNWGCQCCSWLFQTPGKDRRGFLQRGWKEVVPHW